jgi:hypothetical protein
MNWSVTGLELGRISLEEAIGIADAAVFAKTYKHLSTLQVEIFRGAWFDLKYSQISQTYHCSEIHVKMSASVLWELLSQALDEKVTKKTFRAALERYSNPDRF